MNELDMRIKKLAKAEKLVIPQEISLAFEETLSNLPEKKTSNGYKPRRILRPILASAAVLVFVVFFALPNISENVAYAMEKIPVIGDMVRVFTIRNYSYQDEYHELDAKIPSIEVEDEDDNVSSAVSDINKSTEELTNSIIEQYYNDVEKIGDDGHTALQIDYDIITDNESWFTLKLTVHRDAGSGSTNYKFSHIDKQTGRIVELSDLFKSDSEYKESISEEIRKQMRSEMEVDNTVTYWLDSEIQDWNFASIDENQNFYFSENGNIVIVFDKYEVGPGTMGCPEFEIPANVYEDCLKEVYK